MYVSTYIVIMLIYTKIEPQRMNKLCQLFVLLDNDICCAIATYLSQY